MEQNTHQILNEIDLLSEEDKLKSYVQQWFEMSNAGDFQGARDFYFENLFNEVIRRFEKNNSETLPAKSVLFSVLGFTPEPIILTQRAIQPTHHVIFYNIREKGFDEEVNKYLNQYLTSDYHLIELQNESFNCIYETLKEQMLLYPATDYVLDITGGKKSMVASAAIFGRDYNFNITYVDYEKYDPNLRRPLPGTELLNIVYSPLRDLPEYFHPIK